jgi:putative transcriptional regulator
VTNGSQYERAGTGRIRNSAHLRPVAVSDERQPERRTARHDRLMTSQRGRLLLAGPYLYDPNFFRSVVLVLEHTDEGAIGVVLNRPTDVTVLDALPEWAEAVTSPPVVFAGGPVAPGSALALGTSTDGDDDDDPLVGDLAVVDLETPADQWRQVRLFSGYAGWAAGQLEAELAEDAWFVLDALPSDIRTTDPENLWSEVLGRQPGPLALLARYPDQPAFN